jgi:hypothetical protein
VVIDRSMSEPPSEGKNLFYQFGNTRTSLIFPPPRSSIRAAGDHSTKAIYNFALVALTVLSFVGVSRLGFIGYDAPD